MKSYSLSVRTILICLAACISGCTLGVPSRTLVVQGATLIDGTGSAAVPDSIVIVQDGRFQAVGKRGEVAIPEGAEVIDAKGKTILPGLIDGHCHYRDWMGEIYLAYGVLTCPNISNNPVEWIISRSRSIGAPFLQRVIAAARTRA